MATAATAAATEPDLQAVERTQAHLDAFLAEVRRTSIILPPPPPPLNLAEPLANRNSTSQPPIQGKDGECMIMIFPGAALAPTNYKALATATSQAAAAKYGAAGLRCWVAVAGVDLLQLLPLLGELEALEQPSAPPGTVPLPTAEMLGPMVMKEVSRQAAEQGFDDRSSRSGRLTNVLVATHSASGLYFGDAAVKHAGGLAMLGSTWSSEVLGKLAIAGGWLAGSRPMMMLTGELDGQMGWPHIMPYAAQAAWCGLRQGATYAIINKPLILLPGVNHGQLCGSAPNLARGDCVPDNSEAQALDTAADCLTAFLVLHFLPQPPPADSTANNEQQHGKSPDGPHSNWPRPPSAAAAHAALGVLQRGVHWTVNALTPYAAAVGMGDLRGTWIRAVAIDQAAAKWEDAWEGPQLPPDPSNPSSISAFDYMVPPPFGISPNVGVPSTATGSTWGTPAPSPPSPMGTMPSRTFALGPLSACTQGLSPGMVMAAERGAAEAQMCIAGGAVAAGLLPPAALGRVRVVASVHPALNSFLYSQPTVRSLPGGRAEVHVQCFQHFPALDRPTSSPSGLYPASPDLWLKLKSGIGLAIELRHELGLPNLASEEGAAEKQGKMGKPVDLPEGSPAAAAAKGMKGVGKMVIAGTEEGAVSAADVNRAALEWALQAAPEDVHQRYLARGVPLEFGEDQVAESPPSWVRNSRISYEVQTGPPSASSPSDGVAANSKTEPQQVETSTGANGSSPSSPSEQQQQQPRAVLVRSPVLRGIVADDVSQLGSEDRRFLGSLYIKVMSRAMALEWVSIGGVRQATQGTKCLWGGH